MPQDRIKIYWYLLAFQYCTIFQKFMINLKNVDKNIKGIATVK